MDEAGKVYRNLKIDQHTEAASTLLGPMEDDADTHPEYVRAIIEMVTRLAGLSHDFQDEVVERLELRRKEMWT